MCEEGYNEPYPAHDKIDFSRIHSLFRDLVLFDNVYLSMQGMNIAINDGFITEMEYKLLREYFEIERTPTQSALFVSAQSQMWIFALYELLRTWRQRVRKLFKWEKSGALDEMLGRLKRDEHNFGALMQSNHLERVRDDPDFSELMKKHFEVMEPVFRMTEEIRMNLAKHEVQGKPNIAVRAPGYGRINMHCGAMDYELDLGDNTYRTINRRDIAEALRCVKVPKAKALGVKNLNPNPLNPE